MKTAGLRTHLGYSAPAIGLAGLSLPLLAYLPSHYAAIGVPLNAIGLAFLLTRLIDIPLDPAIGAAIDRTKRADRYRLWLGLATPLLMLGVAGLFLPPAGAGAGWLLIFLVITYIGYSTCAVAHLGWGCALAGDYRSRNRLFGWSQAAHVLGVLAPAVIPLLIIGSPALANGVTAGFIIGAMALGVLIAILLVPVPAQEHAPRRAALRDYLRLIAKPAVARLLVVDLLTGMAVFTCGTLFFIYFGNRGMERGPAAMLFLLTNGGSLIGAWLWAWLGNRIGKHGAAVVAFTSFAVLLLAIQLLPLPRTIPGAMLMLAFGATLCAGPVLIRSMLADAGDLERLEDGLDQSGLLAALFLASNKLGMAIGPGVAFLLLAQAGYRAGGAAQTVAASSMLDALAIWAPATIGLLSAAIIAGYRLDRARHQSIRAELS